MTWVEFAVLHVVGAEDLVMTYLEEALDFHRTTTSRAAGNLVLLGDNTFRTPWTAAQLLCSDPGSARAAAKTLSHHLDTTRPGNRTLFESHLIEQDNLFQDLAVFAASDPPLVLWKGHGNSGASTCSLVRCSS